MLRRKSLLALGGLVVLVIFGSSATTSALWRDSVPLGAGEINSGSIGLLNGDQTTQQQSWTLSGLTAGEMTPGSYTQAPLVLSSNGTVTSKYGLSKVESTTIAASLLITATVVSSITDCATGGSAASPAATPLYQGPLATAQTPQDRPLAPGATEVWCLRVTLDPAAPSNVQGQSPAVTFTFEATS